MAQVQNLDVRSGKESEKLFKLYRPLLARHIRLLELLPHHSQAVEDGIQCNIVEASLDDRLIYAALSYCWGLTKPDKQFLRILNHSNHKFSITDSLAEAFRQFRLKDKPRLVWADFISINQADSNEKGIQVALMTEIYDQASEVLAWVGPGSPEDSDTFEMEAYMTDYHARTSKLMELERVAAFTRFLTRDWFSRMWIVQEAAIARRLTLCCGNKRMDWRLFRLILDKMLNDYGFMLNMSHTDVGLERIMTIVGIRNIVSEHINLTATNAPPFRIANLDRIDLQRMKPAIMPGDFARFVSRGRFFGCMDQRDRIYALRGVVMEDEKGGSPDYTKSDPLVFEEFAVSTMFHSRKVNLLSQAGIHNNSLPSWVPDWSRRLGAYALGVESFRASRFTEFVPEDNPKPGRLVLAGYLVDTIIHLLSGFDNSECPLLDESTPKSQPWTKGEQPSSEKLRLFEGTLSGLTDIKSTDAEVSTKDFTHKDEQSWKTLALDHGGREVYPDLLHAYRGILTGGGPPIPALEGGVSMRFHETLYSIWIESLSRESGAEDAVVCPVDLKIAYFQGVRKKNSDTKECSREQYKQTGGDKHSPILTDRRLYEAVKTASGRRDDEPSNLGMTEQESRVAYYENADPFFKANDDSEVKRNLARLYSRQVERMAGRRKFGITDSGYMIWAPEIVVQGDLIWILEGGNVPYVLRSGEVQDEYRLVGEAYVEGLMMGEWFRGKSSGKLQKIVLI